MSTNEQLSANELAAKLEGSRAALHAAIEGMDEEAFRRRTAPGEWNAAELLAHLLAHEHRMQELAQLALNEDNPAVRSRGDQAHIDGAKAAQRMPVPQIVHGLLAQRRDTLRVLQPLASQQLARAVQHSRMGDMSVSALMRKVVDHEIEHATQITSMRAALAGTAS